MTSSNVKYSLVTTDKQTDLGVIIDIYIEIIQRTFQFLDTQTFLSLDKTMIRSHLDYAIAVWYRYKIKHKIAIENIKRRAIKELPGMWYEGLIIYRKTKITEATHISIPKAKRRHDRSL